MKSGESWVADVSLEFFPQPVSSLHKASTDWAHPPRDNLLSRHQKSGRLKKRLSEYRWQGQPDSESLPHSSGARVRDSLHKSEFGSARLHESLISAVLCGRVAPKLFDSEDPERRDRSL